MAFPASPTLGQRHYTHTQTWEWSGSSWARVYGVDDSAIVRVHPDEPAGQIIGSNAAALAGYPIIADTPVENDMLRFNSGAWRNISQTNVTDGGNF